MGGADDDTIPLVPIPTPATVDDPDVDDDPATDGEEDKPVLSGSEAATGCLPAVPFRIFVSLS